MHSTSSFVGNMNHLVTCSIPNFNSGDLLCEAIESVLNQTYTNWELFVTDDCSTDNSFTKALQRFSDPRITFTSSVENSGPQEIRNQHIAEANGAFLAILDADDTWNSTKLEKQVQFMTRNPTIFAVGAYVFRGSNIQTAQIATKPHKCDQLAVGIFWSNPIWNNTLLFRTKWARKHKVFYNPNEYSEDTSFFISAQKNNLLFANIKEPLAFYRTHDSQMTSSLNRIIESATKQRLELLKFYWPSAFSKDEAICILKDCDDSIRVWRKFKRINDDKKSKFPAQKLLSHRITQTIITKKYRDSTVFFRIFWAIKFRLMCIYKIN